MTKALLRRQRAEHNYHSDPHTYIPPSIPPKKTHTQTHTTGLIRQEKCAAPTDTVPVSDKARTDINAGRQEKYNMQLCRQKNGHAK